MYNPGKKQYIFKQCSEKIWSFYYNDKLGLCYSILTDQKRWSEPISIKKNISSLFYADMDTEDNFHFLFEDNEGNVCYSRLTDQSFNTVPVLKSKTKNTYNKHLFLLPFKNNIQLFYTLKHESKVMLAHQTISDGKVSKPVVIDYVPDDKYPYSIAFENPRNMYIFYQSSDGSHMQIGYKKFVVSKRSWSEFTPLTRYQGYCRLPQTIVDTKNILHMCYQRLSDKNQYELVYLRKIPDKNIWTDEVIIHSSIYPFDNLSMMCVIRKDIIFWIRDDVVYYSSSDNGGSSWNKPARQDFYGVRELSCISYKTNDTLEKEKIMVKEVPAIIFRGIRIAFYRDITAGMNTAPNSESAAAMIDNIKILTQSLSDLKKSYTSMMDELSRLNTKNQTIERELVKQNAKLTIIENKISKYDLMSDKLEDCRKYLHELRSKDESAKQENTNNQ